MILLYPVIFVVLFVSLFYIYTFFEGKEEKRVGKIDGKVSILVPAYNAEEDISRLIKALLTIDYGDKEILVVDDGSTDKTYDIAKLYEKEGVKVFRKKNGGKASALNFGVKKCTGDFLYTVDADCLPQKDALKNMLNYFDEGRVMAVVPTMKPYKPKNIVERAQDIEYVLTAFIRKMLFWVSALNVSPGAPLYRMSFIKSTNGFDENTLTEDLEMGMRIQSQHYNVALAWDARVYTVVPNTFKGLMRQRQRWGYGTLENLTKYKSLFNLNYGNLGVFYLPATLFFAVYPALFLIYMASRAIGEGLRSLGLLSSIKYDVIYTVTHGNLSVTVTPLLLLFICSAIIGVSTYYLARKSVEREGLKLSYIAYILIYGWVLALFQLIVLVRYMFKKRPEW